MGEDTNPKSTMFSMEWYKQDAEKQYDIFLDDANIPETDRGNVSKMMHYRKQFSDLMLKSVDQTLSDKHPSGRPKGKNLFSRPFYRTELLAYRDYLENDWLDEPGDKILKAKEQNPFPSIFRDPLTHNLFSDLHESYKDRAETHTANYSFVYYSMKNDGFLVCTGIEFITFLSKEHQIEIDRIDNRQSGINKKTDFYESTAKANKLKK